MTSSASLLGARIRRIDAPSPDLWAITLAATEVRGTLLVSLQPGATGIGWSDKRPHGLPATSFVQKLRKELEGGRLQALEEVGPRLELSIARAQQALQLAFDFSTQNVLLYASDKLVASAHNVRSARADGATRRVGSVGVGTSATPLASGAVSESAVSDSRQTARGGTEAGPRADQQAGRGAETARSADAQRGSGESPHTDGIVFVDLAADSPARESAMRERRVAIEIDLAELEERARALLADRSEALLALRKNALVRGLRASRKKLERKQAAIAGDAARADEAPALRQRAQLLLSNLHAIPRGAVSASVLDYTTDPPAHIEIELNPAQQPRELAEAWFKRAKRFERGAALAAQRVAAGAAELATVAALEQEIEACADTATLDELAVRAERSGVKSELPSQVGPVAKSREPTRHAAYRTLLGAGARQILVGKGASDNDVLTREHARPHDLWLHARDVAGAHVVVPLSKNETCPQELLIDAAHAAAHFSDARGETTLDVSYTPRRYVRKPKGSPPGQVTLEREKVLRLQLEPARLAKLLQTERA